MKADESLKDGIAKAKSELEKRNAESNEQFEKDAKEVLTIAHSATSL